MNIEMHTVTYISMDGGEVGGVITDLYTDLDKLGEDVARVIADYSTHEHREITYVGHSGKPQTIKEIWALKEVLQSRRSVFNEITLSDISKNEDDIYIKIQAHR